MLRGRSVDSTLPKRGSWVGIFLRLLCLIFFFAFASLWLQLPGLYGKSGVLPVSSLLDQALKRESQTQFDLFLRYPSTVVLAWYHSMSVDHAMDLTCMAGMAISLMGFHYGCGCVLMFLQFFLYLSMFHVGQTFLHFQWDILLLETGFASIFLARPLFWGKWRSNASEKRNGYPSPPLSALFLLRFILFKLMFMSGVVKIQANCPTWLKLTACHYHFATQCLPTPLAWYVSKLPNVFLKLSVAGTLWLEIAAPVLILVPLPGVQRVAAILQIILQLFIIPTGNYNFFNLLTIALCLTLLEESFSCSRKGEAEPAVGRRQIFEHLDKHGLCLVYDFIQKYSWTTYAFCLGFAFTTMYQMFRIRLVPEIDIELSLSTASVQRFVDKFLPMMISIYGVLTVFSGLYDLLLAFKERGKTFLSFLFHLLWKLFVFVMVILLFTAGVVPMIDQLTPNARGKIWPAAKRAYDLSVPWSISNGYGLFRKMTGVGDAGGDGLLVSRPEIELQGKLGDQWIPYNFTFKPGDVTLSPPWVAPHQPRLDWQMWFAALKPRNNIDRWLLNLVYKLLIQEKSVLALLGPQRNQAFEDSPPSAIRILRYNYNFTSSGSDSWWEREYLYEHVSPFRSEDENLKKLLKQQGFEVKTRMETAESWVENSNSIAEDEEGETIFSRVWTLHRYEILFVLFWTWVIWFLVPKVIWRAAISSLHEISRTTKRKRKNE